MDFNDLYASRDAIKENANDLEIAMTEFIEAQEAILHWLQDWDLQPNGYSVQLQHPDSVMRIVITFDNDALVSFAAVEEEFWRFVRDVMPLDFDHTSTADDRTPFRSAEFRELDWDVVVVPDLHSDRSRFPDVEFWERQARNERLRQEQLADLMRRERISEVLIGLDQICEAA